MTPTYEIIAHAGDKLRAVNISDKIRGRLVSLTLTDNAGDQADALTLVLSNADESLELPNPGATLQLKLGYEGRALRDFGTFTLDEVRESSPPSQITLTAKSACYAEGSRDYTPMHDRKTRSWEAGNTIAGIVQTIAGEARLAPVVTSTAAKIVPGHLDQTDESDLNFLTRLAERYNSRCVPMFGKLIFAHADDVRVDKTTGSEASDTNAVPVYRDQITSHEYTRKRRRYYVSCTAIWRDKAGSRDVVELIGPDAEPRFAITGVYPDQRSAREAANTKLLDLRRAGTTLDITLPAPPAMNFYAQGSIRAVGFASHINGVWKLTSVEWNLSNSGFVCSLKSEVTMPENTGTGVVT